MKTRIQAQNILGESPLWDHEEKCLYWVDMIGGLVNQYHPGRRTLKEWKIHTLVACVALTDDPNLLLLALSDRFALLNIKTGELSEESDSRLDNEAVRFNDGKVDSEGRFWIGTTDQEEKHPYGALYCLADGVLAKQDDGFTISNGMGWNREESTLYVTDSKSRTIYQYDYAKGKISNRRLFVEIPEDQGNPDGLTIDKENCIWGSHWDGGRITRYSPDGTVKETFELPVSRPTSCCFGGAHLSTLFITSASYELSEQEKEAQPEAGNLFSIATSARGIPEYRFSLNHYYSKR